MFRQLDFKESTIKRHLCHFNHLKEYMRMNGQNLYNETVGEKYQFDIFTEGNASDYKLSCVKKSIDQLNVMLNHVPMQKKHIQHKTFPLPGEFGKHARSFLDQFKAESRTTEHTMHMYITALSHFSVRMHQDRVYPEKLDNGDISRFVTSLQNTQLYVCGPFRRFLRYLFEMKFTKTDLSIPLKSIKSHRAEKVPSVYNAEEIRKMDASIEKSGPVGKRDYAIFLLASRLGLRASDICSLQFCNLAGIEMSSIWCNVRRRKKLNCRF